MFQSVNRPKSHHWGSGPDTQSHICLLAEPLLFLLCSLPGSPDGTRKRCPRRGKEGRQGALTNEQQLLLNFFLSQPLKTLMAFISIFCQQKIRVHVKAVFFICWWCLALAPLLESFSMKAGRRGHPSHTEMARPPVSRVHGSQSPVKPGSAHPFLSSLQC